jgi:hypothetical protein
VCENLFVHIKLHFQTSSGLTPGTFFRRHRSFAGKNTVWVCSSGRAAPSKIRFYKIHQSQTSYKIRNVAAVAATLHYQSCFEIPQPISIFNDASDPRSIAICPSRPKADVSLSMRRYGAVNQPLHAQLRSAFSNYHQQNHLIVFPVLLPNNPDRPLIDRPWRVASYFSLRRKQANSVKSSLQTDKKLKFQLFPWPVSPPPEQRLCQLP